MKRMILFALATLALILSCQSTALLTDDELIDWLSTPVPVVISK